MQGYVITHLGHEMKGLYVPDANIYFYVLRGGNPDPQLNAFTVLDRNQVLAEHQIGPVVEVADEIVTYAAASEQARHRSVNEIASWLQMQLMSQPEPLPDECMTPPDGLIADDDDHQNSEYAEQVFAIIAAAEGTSH